MARKGENIFKRNDGRWEGRYIKKYINGKAVYGFVYGKTYLDVKKKKSEAISAMKKAELQATDSSTGEKDSPTIKVISAMWMDSLRATRKASTLVKYKNQLNTHILPVLGNKKISEIKNEDIISFSNSLLGKKSGGKNLSNKSVSEILSRIKSIRRYALIHGYNVGFIPECINIPINRKELRVLSLEEERTLLQYISAEENLTSMGIILCLFTGIRIGELCALTWNDISISDQKLHVKRTMQRLQNLDEGTAAKTYISIDEPKSKCSIRTIPLPENIMDKLRSAYTKDAYVLTGSAHSFVEPRTMENRFKRILIKCGIEDANFHTLRHTFATRCIEVGFDIKSLSEILGHANVNITLDFYVHPTMKMKRDNMEKLSKLFTVK